MKSKGLSLITTLVYVGLLALVLAVATRLTAGLLHANAQAQLAGEVIDNAQSALATITQEIQQADGVYTPTSLLNATPGQLSLATRHNLPTDETITYVDFYVDDQHLYVKREGSAGSLITSPRVKISHLEFTHLNSASPYPAVRIAATFAADVPDSKVVTQTSIALTKTISLRAYSL